MGIFKKREKRRGAITLSLIRWRRPPSLSREYILILADPNQNWRLSVFKGWVPAEAGGDGRPVVFALQHELLAAVIEAEDFVVEVEAIHNEGQAMRQANAALGVNLKVRVEIIVTEGALQTEGRNIGRRSVLEGSAIGELVGGDIGTVVGEADADGDATAIVSRANVPCIGRIAKKARMIGASRQSAGAGSGVAIIRGDAEA